MTSQDIDNLDQILSSIYNYGFPNTGMPGSQEQMSEEQARAALLKWRDKAVVAELKAAHNDLYNFTAQHDQEFAEKARDFLEGRIKQYKERNNG